MGTGEGIDREGKWIEGALAASAEDGHQDVLCLGAKPGAIAAPDFAIHDRPSCLLRIVNKACTFGPS